MEKKPYAMPEREFGHKESEPLFTEKKLRLHHQKHHAALEAIRK